MDNIFGYGKAYNERFRDIYHGIETKKEFAFAVGTIPGSLIFGASRARPLYGIQVSVRYKILNSDPSVVGVGSDELIINKIMSDVELGDGFDILGDYGLRSIASAMHAYFDEESGERYEDIPAAGEFAEPFVRFVIPIYSEIPVWMTGRINSPLTEYTGGTLSLVDTDNTKVWIAGVYGNGVLGMEQPMIHSHSEALGTGGNALNSMKELLPFHGILVGDSSHARLETPPILLTRDFSRYQAKDNSNEVVFSADMANISAVAHDFEDNDLSAYINLMTSMLGYKNNDLAETKLTTLFDTTVSYLACYSGESGDLARKLKAYQAGKKSARTT